MRGFHSSIFLGQQNSGISNIGLLLISLSLYPSFTMLSTHLHKSSFTCCGSFMSNDTGGIFGLTKHSLAIVFVFFFVIFLVIVNKWNFQLQVCFGIPLGVGFSANPPTKNFLCDFVFGRLIYTPYCAVSRGAFRKPAHIPVLAVLSHVPSLAVRVGNPCRLCSLHRRHSIPPSAPAAVCVCVCGRSLPSSHFHWWSLKQVVPLFLAVPVSELCSAPSF